MANLSNINEKYLCTECKTLPLKKVFQCFDGHPVCNMCYATSGTSSCHICNISYGSKPIRLSFLEAELDTLVLTCVNEDKGCRATFHRSGISNHQHHCMFRQAVNLCRDMGLQDCSHEITRNGWPEATLAHFRAKHHVVDDADVGERVTLELVYTVADDDGTINSGIWNPVLLKANKSSIDNPIFGVFLAAINKDDGSFSISCIQISNLEQHPTTQYRADYCLRSLCTDVQDLHCSFIPIPYMQCSQVLNTPPFSVRKPMLDKYLENGKLRVEVEFSHWRVSPQFETEKYDAVGPVVVVKMVSQGNLREDLHVSDSDDGENPRNGDGGNIRENNVVATAQTGVVEVSSQPTDGTAAGGGQAATTPIASASSSSTSNVIVSYGRIPFQEGPRKQARLEGNACVSTGRDAEEEEARSDYESESDNESRGVGGSTAEAFMPLPATPGSGLLPTGSTGDSGPLEI